MYILSCRGGYLYTGYTTNLRRRLNQHEAGKGSKFTRSHLPVKLVYHETYKTVSEALKREIAIKQLSRTLKIGLIRRAV